MDNRGDKLAAVNRSGKGSGDLGVESELAELRTVWAEIRRMRISAQQELQLVRQMRAKAERNSREIETKARSQAQLLILQARLAIKKQIVESSRKADEEMKKVLADIRLIRSTAQKELETQQKFTNAARLKALSLVFPEEDGQGLGSMGEVVGLQKV